MVNKFKRLLNIRACNITKKYNLNQIDKDWSFIILNKEKAWLLGLIFGDGHVDKYVTRIYSGDLEVLNKVNKLFFDKLTISKRKESNTYNIAICSKKIADELHDIYFLKNNKSSNIEFPYFINDEFWNHFIRGLFDSDGSFGIHKPRKNAQYLRFQYATCSKNMAYFLNDVLNKKLNLTIKVAERQQRGNWSKQYHINMIGSSAIKLGYLIYEGVSKNILLNRKYEIWKKFADLDKYKDLKTLIT